ncbi:Hemicentin-1 [Mactra antiquata]
MSFLLLIVLTFLLQGCVAVNVILQPTDTAREIGTNVTLACVVTDKTPSENVQWKHKPEGSDAFNALTFNENVLSDPTKYSIRWTYNLTVHNLQPEDAGLYRCTAGGVDYDATLTVVDLPDNVTIEMVGSPNIGETHNLTCKVFNGLPLPTVRWLINGVDMTSNAVIVNTSSTPNGMFYTEYFISD